MLVLLFSKVEEALSDLDYFLESEVAIDIVFVCKVWVHLLEVVQDLCFIVVFCLAICLAHFLNLNSWFVNSIIINRKYLFYFSAKSVWTVLNN